MPELPEVEITRRGVDQHFLNQRLTACVVHQPRLRWPVPDRIEECVGRVLTSTERRSKYLILNFEGLGLVVHLGMSGTFGVFDDSAPLATHDHVVLSFGQRSLRFNDPRRFGSIDVVECGPGWQSSYARFAALGPEPLEAGFEFERFYRSLKQRKASIKAVLLSGVAVVGVGNIYACEALFRSGIRPGRAACRVTRAEAKDLQRDIIDVLNTSLERGGSSLRDFQSIDGELGHFQTQCDVYGREGELCKRCTGVIKRKVQNQRSSFYCPVCQR